MMALIILSLDLDFYITWCVSSCILIEVGKGRYEVSDVPKLLESKNRKNVISTRKRTGWKDFIFREKFT